MNSKYIKYCIKMSFEPILMLLFISINRGDFMSGQRTETAKRYRSAREDAKVGSIERRIEEDYGLPKGSVQINRPDGSNARSDKKIGNLRKEHE
ncbi:MAG: hypothetical protein LLG02_16350 [Pelosinus sp.]|nr:hypothetical protein [Pelosinus sp.]